MLENLIFIANTDEESRENLPQLQKSNENKK